MAGLVPAIHVFLGAKTWMPGTRPGMTVPLLPHELSLPGLTRQSIFFEDSS
jgi:hypothetical protein